MPRAVKVKSSMAAAGAPAAKKKPATGKRNKLYAMPEKVAEGTVLTDLAKGQWRIGPSIGTGGFGEIYSACRVGEKKYDYVVKCEPHGNGPLFVEMHFYMRNARLEDIEKFKKEHGMKSLGMPYMIGNGSAEVNGQKHRFIVMPRYGSDVARHFVDNGRRLPEGTIYRLALQMLDVYEFIHACGYVHADLKAANILLGHGRAGGAQAYLVDYGLASHYTTKEYKPDPKKMHNGTIEYTSRDAHLGIATMRADLEILGYNLIEWMGVQLPWVQNKLLATPVKVQQAKNQFMDNTAANLKQLYANDVPVAIADFMKYVAAMEYNEQPNYEKCRKMFSSALKSLKIANTGDLVFKLTTTSNNNASPSTSKGRAKAKVAAVPLDSSVEEICASDDDDGDVIFEPKRTVKTAPTNKLRTTARPNKKDSPINKKVSPISKKVSPISKKVSPTNKTTALGKVTRKITPPSSPMRRKPISPAKAIAISPIKVATRHSPTHSSLNLPPSPTNRKRPSPASAATKTRVSPNTKKARIDANVGNTPQTSSSSRPLRSTPVSAKANINFSPSVSVRPGISTSSSSLATRNGKTVINDNLTPNPRAGKTYEFNFELDVSMDANVIVNVKRKKKASSHASPRVNGHQHSASRSRTATTEDSAGDTPVTRVKVRKLDTAEDAAGSARSPAVTVKKSKRLVSPR